MSVFKRTYVNVNVIFFLLGTLLYDIYYFPIVIL